MGLLIMSAATAAVAVPAIQDSAIAAELVERLPEDNLAKAAAARGCGAGYGAFESPL
jgi:hypothetical protein